MAKKGNIYCMGIQCAVKNQCSKYIDGIGATVYDGTNDKYIRKCTNQKHYIRKQ